MAAACLSTGNTSALAQSTVVNGVSVTCPTLTILDPRRPSGSEISLATLTLSGAIWMPIADQDAMVRSIELKTRGDSVEGVTEEALERVTAGWQDRGYFKVHASGKAKTLAGSHDRRIAIEVRVDEGMQYRLGEIMFKNNKIISDVATLRGFSPIKDGDVFGREEITAGLENLRKAYGELGYINFTAVPGTTFDDAKGMISLDVDLDQGKQFHVGSINIIGLDEHSRREILKDFPIGQIYNEKLFRLFLEKYSSVFKLHADDPRLIERRLDEPTGTIAITLYACPCTVC